MDASPALSLESLFHAHVDDVHRVVGRLLGPGAVAADVEDLVQEVFLAAQRALPGFRGEAKVTTWLYGIASRTVLVHLRKRWRYRRLRDALGLHIAATPASSTMPLETRDTLRQVWRCLARLSPKKRAVYVLCEIEGIAGEEVAAALGLPLNTVWTRLHHARRELWRELAAAGLEELP
jgi:RNA polymerase sigma-70 factor (ECF subfamily)